MPNLVTNYTLNLAMNEVVNRTVQVRAHTGNPGANGTQNGLARDGIANQDVAAAGWTDAASGDVANANAINFGTYTGAAAATVNHLSLWAGANHMFNIEVGTPKTLTNGDPLTIPAGDLDLTSMLAA